MGKNTIRFLGLFGAFTIFAGGMTSAFADSTSTTTPAIQGTGTPVVGPAPSPSLHDRIADKVVLSYFMLYTGAQVNDPGNKYQPGDDGNLNLESVQSFENVVTTGWKFNKDYNVGVILHSYYSPLGSPVTPALGSDNWHWLDPAINFGRNSAIDLGGGLKIKPSFSATLPMSHYDRLKRDGTVTGLTPLANISYDVPGTKLTAALYSYLTIYVPGSDAVDGYRSFKFVMAPNFNYQLTKTLAATVWVDLVQLTRKHGTGFYSGISNPNMDIEPGVAWDVTSFLTFNPFLNIYPVTPTLNATSFQAVLAGKIF